MHSIFREGINWLYSRHPYLNFSDLFWCVLEVCFVEWLPENVVDLVPVKHPHPLWPGALGRAVVEVIQVHVVFGLGIAGIKKTPNFRDQALAAAEAGAERES